MRRTPIPKASRAGSRGVISFRPFPLSVVVVRGETLLSVPAARRLVEAICREDAPTVCVCLWVQCSDGSYRPESWPYRWSQVTPELLRALGFAPALDTRARRDTLQRLANAGFVRLARISPGCTLLDMDSWAEHLGRCLADPDYWEKDGAAFRKYAKSNFTKNP